MVYGKSNKSYEYLDLLSIYKLLRRSLARAIKSCYVLYYAAASIKLYVLTDSL